ncbi:hypothetical protein P7C70_g1156, partial [Phenoliferia sp. Uapishka_3]
MSMSEPEDSKPPTRRPSMKRSSSGVTRANSTCRPQPRNIGGPSYQGRERGTSKEREVWGLGAVLPDNVRKRAANHLQGEEGLDGRSVKSSSWGGGSDAGRTPAITLAEVEDPFDVVQRHDGEGNDDDAQSEDGSVTGLPTTHSPGLVIFEDKVLEPEDIKQYEEEKQKQGGSGNSKDAKRLDAPLELGRTKTRRGSNATNYTTATTEDQGQLGGELAEDRDQWDAMEDEMIDTMTVRNSWGRVRFVCREPLAEFLGMLVLIILGVGDNGGNASASLFVTVPNASIGGTGVGFGQEVLATAVLTIVVLALGDENNAPPGAGLGALVIGFLITAIGMSLGWQTGYAINPARDFGPRVALWTLGYGSELWTHNGWWWIIGPICGPIVGSIGGALVYDLCIFTGDGSPINYTSVEIANAVSLPPLHSMVPKAFRSSFAGAEAAASSQSDAEAGYFGVRKHKRGEVRTVESKKGKRQVEDTAKGKWRCSRAKKGSKMREDARGKRGRESKREATEERK